MQYGATLPVCSLSALRSTSLLKGSAHLGPRGCISICSLVHRCVQRAERTKSRGSGQASGGCLEPRRRHIKASSDPWNTTKPDTPPSYTPGPDSQIIPIMQHVCDCRNPPWPLRSSSWRTVPETPCQAASGGTRSTPRPRRTRRHGNLSPPRSL